MSEGRKSGHSAAKCRRRCRPTADALQGTGQWSGARLSGGRSPSASPREIHGPHGLHHAPGGARPDSPGGQSRCRVTLSRRWLAADKPPSAGAAAAAYRCSPAAVGGALFFFLESTVFAPRRRHEDPYLAPPRLCTYNRVAVSSASPSNSLRTGIAALLPYDRNPPCRRSAERTTTTT